MRGLADALRRYSPDKQLFKVNYYLRGFWSCLRASRSGAALAARALARYSSAPEEEKADIRDRVDYYNRIETPFSAAAARCTAASYARGKSWAYHLDFKPLIACFPQECRFEYLFGDSTQVPEMPTFIKSRPVRSDRGNRNAVLLKLNQVRHYYLIADRLRHEQKKPMAVWRGGAYREKRRLFLERCYGKPLCDVGDVSRKSLGTPWHRPHMSIREQLEYRFVISVEGNDVATNVKWIMASNSLCLMTRPEYETWFMEGRLVPGHHYVQLRDDYADIEEKIAYYTEHPDEAESIIRNAKAYVRQFMDREREFLISLLVMDKYFRMSGQPSLSAAERP